VADKVLINLATGMEDKERVLVAFLVATAAVAQGKEVVVWTTKDAVRLGLPGEMTGEPCNDCPPLERLFDQFAEGAASSGSALSASTRANSTTPRRWRTRRSSAPRPCRSGRGTTPLSSATDVGST